MYHILKRANCEFSDVVKTTILLKDMNDFQTVNSVYEQCFKNPLGFNELPARMAFQVRQKLTHSMIPRLLIQYCLFHRLGS